MTLDALSQQWVVWSDEGEKVVLAYRPDVFDGGDFPAPCLPTIYVTRGQRDRRPGGQRVGDDWHVTLFLEPEIDCETESYQSRADALAGAVELADEFGVGDIDYRSQYQVPRERYFEKLDELTGR